MENQNLAFMTPPTEDVLVDGLDPFNPDLTDDEKKRIFEAVKQSPYLFFKVIMASQLRGIKKQKLESSNDNQIRL